MGFKYPLEFNLPEKKEKFILAPQATVLIRTKQEPRNQMNTAD